MKRHIFFILLIFIQFTVFSQNFKALIDSGISLHDRGEYDLAIEKYQEALKLQPNSSVANYEISYSYMAKDDYVNAIQYADKVIKLNDENLVPAILTKSSSLDYLGFTDESIKLLKKTIKKHGGSNLLHYNLALDYYKIGEYENAETELHNSLKFKFYHGSSHLLMANAVRMLGRYTESAFCYSFFLVLESDTKRSQEAINFLQRLMIGQVTIDSTEGSEKKININISVEPGKSDFSSAFMAAQMNQAIKMKEKSQNNLDNRELLKDNLIYLFNYIGEKDQKKKSGLWWQHYVPFFTGLEKSEHMETFSYLIFQSVDETASNWVKTNEIKVDAFYEWAKNNLNSQKF